MSVGLSCRRQTPKLNSNNLSEHRIIEQWHPPIQYLLPNQWTNLRFHDIFTKSPTAMIWHSSSWGATTLSCFSFTAQARTTSNHRMKQSNLIKAGWHNIKNACKRSNLFNATPLYASPRQWRSWWAHRAQRELSEKIPILLPSSLSVRVAWVFSRWQQGLRFCSSHPI